MQNPALITTQGGTGVPLITPGSAKSNWTTGDGSLDLSVSNSGSSYGAILAGAGNDVITIPPGATSLVLQVVTDSDPGTSSLSLGGMIFDANGKGNQPLSTDGQTMTFRGFVLESTGRYVSQPKTVDVLGGANFVLKMSATFSGFLESKAL